MLLIMIRGGGASELTLYDLLKQCILVAIQTRVLCKLADLK